MPVATSHTSVRFPSRRRPSHRDELVSSPAEQLPPLVGRWPQVAASNLEREVGSQCRRTGKARQDVDHRARGSPAQACGLRTEPGRPQGRARTSSRPSGRCAPSRLHLVIRCWFPAIPSPMVTTPDDRAAVVMSRQTAVKGCPRPVRSADPGRTGCGERRRATPAEARSVASRLEPASTHRRAMPWRG